MSTPTIIVHHARSYYGNAPRPKRAHKRKLSKRQKRLDAARALARYYADHEASKAAQRVGNISAERREQKRIAAEQRYMAIRADPVLYAEHARKQSERQRARDQAIRILRAVLNILDGKAPRMLRRDAMHRKPEFIHVEFIDGPKR